MADPQHHHTLLSFVPQAGCATAWQRKQDLDNIQSPLHSLQKQVNAFAWSVMWILNLEAKGDTLLQGLSGLSSSHLAQ